MELYILKVWKLSKCCIKSLEQVARYHGMHFDDELMQLEQRVQRDWFSLVFYPVQDETLENAKQAFLETMQVVNDHLGATRGPWFGGQSEPSVIDIIFIPMMERIEASILYWRNVKLRGVFPNIDAWLMAWEERAFLHGDKVRLLHPMFGHALSKWTRLLFTRRQACCFSNIRTRWCVESRE